MSKLQCPDFDPAYTQRIREQNAAIIAVIDSGVQRVCDKNLRDISGEIRKRLTSANDKVGMALPAAGCGPSADQVMRAQAIIADLCQTGQECYDVTYAKTLSELIKQSQAANTLAATSATCVALKNQAAFMADKECDWAFRLDRWTAQRGNVCGGAPMPVGCGPKCAEPAPLVVPACPTPACPTAIPCDPCR